MIQQFLITRTISFKKELNLASGKKNQLKKQNKTRTPHVESKTVVLINSVLMTTLILLFVMIQMVHLQRAVEMSRFGN